MIRRAVFGLLLLAAVGLTGCSSGRAEVTFTKNQSGGKVYESFPGAYITSSRDGEYDIVLVNDTLRSLGRQPDSGKPLQPINQPPLEQAIHIHLFWQPVEGAMIKESSITNAIIHWYVFSGEGSREVDMLHYEGAAFVTLATKGNSAHIIIGDGEIKTRQVQGHIHDPVGDSKISGSIIAVRNDTKVRELLASFQAKAAGKDPFRNGVDAGYTAAVEK